MWITASSDIRLYSSKAKGLSIGVESPSWTSSILTVAIMTAAYQMGILTTIKFWIETSFMVYVKLFTQTCLWKFKSCESSNCCWEQWKFIQDLSYDVKKGGCCIYYALKHIWVDSYCCKLLELILKLIQLWFSAF